MRRTAAVADLLHAIINDERRILTTSVVDGTGKDSVAISMPRIIGENGALMKLNPEMKTNERNALHKSAKIVRKNFDLL